MSSLNLRCLPGHLDVVDTRHPDRLDWRQVALSIDLNEGRWFHISISPKPGGRDIADVAACALFKQAVNAEIQALANFAFPDRERHVLGFDGDMIHHNMPPPVKEAGIHFGIHVNAVSQRFMQALSNHQWLELAQAWDRLIATNARKRAAPAG